MNNEINDKYIYLLSSLADYQIAKANGELYRDSLESEGFIHASPKDQLTRVANKYYKDVENPLVIVLETARITPEVKWEAAAGSLYPHIYGLLNMDSVIKTIAIELESDGHFAIEIS